MKLPNKNRLIGFFGALVFVLAVVLWRMTNAGPPVNVILITLDTLRADHLPMYGYKGVETPELEKLTAEGVLFQNVTAQAPITLPSHTTILTGTYPFFHNVRNNGDHYASDALNTTAEIYKAAGYDTAAFVGSFVLDSRFGLDQGFDTYDDDMVDGRQKHTVFEFKDRLAENSVGRVLDWLTQRKQTGTNSPFFLWLHLFDAHKEYNPPEPFFSQYIDRLYDGEIAYIDSQLSRLFDRLRSEGIYDNTLIVLTADHGESLGEHGELTHSIFIYNATNKVPLVIKLPGNRLAGTKVDALVRHIDLLPTQLDVAGVTGETEKLTGDIQGVSLLPLMEGDTQEPLTAYAEGMLPYYYYQWSPPRSIQSGKYKYIHLPTPELYDMGKDPHELNNLAKERPDDVQRLLAALKQLKKTHSEGKPSESQRKMDEETLNKLKSLGYIHGGEQMDAAAPTEPELDDLSRPDPKDKIGVQQAISRIQNLLNAKMNDQALQLIQRLLPEDPKNIKLISALASALLQQGNVDGGITAFNRLKQIDPTSMQAYTGLMNIYLKKRVDLALAKRELSGAFAIEPENPSLWVSKGDLEQMQGELAKAMESYKKAIAMGDQSATLYVGLGGLLNKMDKLVEAKKMLEKALFIQNDYSEANYNLGVVYAREGKTDKALHHYRAAIAQDDSNPFYYTNMGSVLTSLQRYDEAKQAFDQALRRNPNHVEALYNMGTLYLLSDQPKAAIPWLEKTLTLNPGLLYAYNNLAVAYGRTKNPEKAKATYQRMSKAAPKSPQPWLHLARMAWTAGQKNQASKHLKKALSLGGAETEQMIQSDPQLVKIPK